MKSVESINEITKAMQMISTFRFKRAETRFSKIRSYLMELETVLSNLAADAARLKNTGEEGAGIQALFEARPVTKKTLILMTGDKGLCGAYNANLLRMANNWRKQNASSETSFVAVGKVGAESLRKRSYSILASYPEKAIADVAMAKQITEELKRLYREKKTDSIELLYTTFKPGGTGGNKIIPFLPLGYLNKSEGEKTPANVGYIYEPDFTTVFFTLVEKFLEGKIYLALLESLTSEYSARMMAMKQASENGEEVLDELQLLRNKTRQATITRELSEIVSGASVLV